MLINNGKKLLQNVIYGFGFQSKWPYQWKSKIFNGELLSFGDHLNSSGQKNKSIKYI